MGTSLWLEALLECGGEVTTGAYKLGPLLSCLSPGPAPTWTAFLRQALTLQGLCAGHQSIRPSVPGPGAEDLVFSRSFRFDAVLAEAASGASSVVCQESP